MPVTPRPIETKRLTLRPFTRAELEADLVGRAEFEGAVVRESGARVAPDWPNKHWEPAAVRWLLDKMDTFPDEPLWRAWMIFRKDDGGGRTLIGTMGFKGPPVSDGLVETGYGIVNSMWRRGYATEAHAALVDWVRADPRVRGVCAHTMPNDPASGGVLRKSGLTHVGMVHDPEDGDIDRYEKWFVAPVRRDYDACAARVRGLLAGVAVPTFLQRQQAVTRAYWECFGSEDPASESDWHAGRGVSWCGFYDIVPGVGGAEPTEMRLVCREPKPACSPIGLHGMCGRGWKEQRGFVVRDVKVLGENYVACDPRDKSELVVAVADEQAEPTPLPPQTLPPGGGVFDVDSYFPGAFTLDDLRGAERVVRAAGLSCSEVAPSVL